SPRTDRRGQPPPELGQPNAVNNKRGWFAGVASYLGRVNSVSAPCRATTSMDQTMSSANTLQHVYIEELRDLWSANDQMQRVMRSLSEKAADPKLKELLTRSVSVIGQHTAALRSIL